MLFVQLVCIFVGFFFLMPGTGTDYLNVASGMGATIRFAAMLLLASTFASTAIGVISFPIIEEHSRSTAIWFLVISTCCVFIQLVDNGHILSMQTMSQKYVLAAGADEEIYSLLGSQLRATRVWIHYTELLILDIWFAILYISLFVFRLIPRALSGFSIAAVALHLVGIPLAMIIGYPVMMGLAFGIPISYILVGGWLLIKGLPVENRFDTSRNEIA